MTMRFHEFPVSLMERRHHRLPASLLRLAGGAFLAGVMLLFMLATDQVRAADMSLRFDGGIGSQPLAAGAVPNAVFGVNPGGRPWVIDRLNADIGVDGRVRVDGRGLLLAGGNAIGTGGGQTVRARLICGGVFHDSDETFALDARGDFHIGGFLTPRPPTPCATPVLLIINVPAAAGVAPAWFAAGIPKL